MRLAVVGGGPAGLYFSPGTQEIGFSVPDRYNASAILFDNLVAGRGSRCAVTGPSSEVIETRFPLLVEDSRLEADTGGAGASRGGLAMCCGA